MRIVLFPLATTPTVRRVVETTPAPVAEAKKKAASCGLSLSAPGPPGVRKIISDFGVYAKSPTERVGQDGHCRRSPRPRRPRLRARVYRRHGAHAPVGRPSGDRRILRHRVPGNARWPREEPASGAS